MNPLTPPTDNFYKFLSISALVLIVFCAFQISDDNERREANLLQLQSRIFSDTLGYYVAFDNVNYFRRLAADTGIKGDEHAFYLKRKLEWQDSLRAADQRSGANRNAVTYSRTLFDQYDEMVMIYRLLLIVMIPVVVYCYLKWYRMQRLQDLITENEARAANSGKAAAIIEGSRGMRRGLIVFWSLLALGLAWALYYYCYDYKSKTFYGKERVDGYHNLH